MDPRIRIWIHTKMSWIRNTYFTWWISCRGRPCDCREWTRTGCPQTGLPAGSSAVSCTSRKIFKSSSELSILDHEYWNDDPTSQIFSFPDPTIKTSPGKKRAQTSNPFNLCSVADPGCLSRIPDPDFFPSRIQKQQQKREIETKLKIILVLKCWRKNLGQFSKN